MELSTQVNEYIRYLKEKYPDTEEPLDEFGGSSVLQGIDFLDDLVRYHKTK